MTGWISTWQLIDLEIHGQWTTEFIHILIGVAGMFFALMLCWIDFLIIWCIIDQPVEWLMCMFTNYLTFICWTPFRKPKRALQWMMKLWQKPLTKRTRTATLFPCRAGSARLTVILVIFSKAWLWRKEAIQGLCGMELLNVTPTMWVEFLLINQCVEKEVLYL